MGPRLKLPPYVQAFLDRHGNARHYFRRPGFKRVSLPGLPWSPEFMAKHDEEMKAVSAIEIGASRTNPGTVNALVVVHYKSDAWNRLAADTQKTRRRIIEKFRTDHGDKRVALLHRDHIIKMLVDIP